MHYIQEKILNLAKNENIKNFSLRGLGEKVGEKGSPQKIKHHLDQLIAKGFLMLDKDKKTLRPISIRNKADTRIISLPIVGSANCGEALRVADGTIDGYLKISPYIFKSVYNLFNEKNIDNFIVIKAVGNSMNRAHINNESIDDGDYVIVDKTDILPVNGSYVVSVIDGSANIKRFYKNEKTKQISLVSESNRDIPPIYLHERDIEEGYGIAGVVVAVMKKPDELAITRDISGKDVLNKLGHMPKAEHDYYERF